MRARARAARLLCALLREKPIMTPPIAIPYLARSGHDRYKRCCRAAMSPEANRQPSPATHLLADSLTDLLIDLLTYWMSDLIICARASRARRNHRRAIALRRMAVMASRFARRNSQPARLDTVGVWTVQSVGLERGGSGRDQPAVLPRCRQQMPRTGWGTAIGSTRRQLAPTAQP